MHCFFPEINGTPSKEEFLIFLKQGKNLIEKKKWGRGLQNVFYKNFGKTHHV